jgi:hypothetical protein
VIDRIMVGGLRGGGHLKEGISQKRHMFIGRQKQTEKDPNGSGGDGDTSVGCQLF